MTDELGLYSYCVTTDSFKELVEEGTCLCTGNGFYEIAANMVTHMNETFVYSDSFYYLVNFNKQLIYNEAV